MLVKEECEFLIFFIRVNISLTIGLQLFLLLLALYHSMKYSKVSSL